MRPLLPPIRAILAAAVLLLTGLALLACSSPTPTAIPTDTPAPTATTAPTATPAPPPTATPRPDGRTVGVLQHQPEASFQGYTLLARGFEPTAYLIDNAGRVAHQWELDRGNNLVKLLPNGNLLALVGDRPSGRAIQEIAPDGAILWEYDDIGYHHDALKLPNGNVMFLSRGQATYDEAVQAGANPRPLEDPEQPIIYERIVEVRPVGADGGEVVWEWSAWNHLVQDFAPDRPNYGVIADNPGRIDLNYILGKSRSQNSWLHANSLDYHPELDQVLVSVRHFSEVWIIDHSTTTEEAAGSSGGNSGKGGEILYRWGNPRAWGRGNPSAQQLFFQHHAQWIEAGYPGAGNILAFSNGNEFKRFNRGYSSIEEFTPPADGYGYGPAAGRGYGPEGMAWSYAAPNPSDFFSPIGSGVQRLPNGNTLICAGTTGRLFEVTPAGEIVWEYISPLVTGGALRQGESVPDWQPPAGLPYRTVPPGVLDNILYRAYRYAPDYPGLQPLTLTPESARRPLEQ